MNRYKTVFGRVPYSLSTEQIIRIVDNRDAALRKRMLLEERVFTLAYFGYFANEALLEGKRTEVEGTIGKGFCTTDVECGGADPADSTLNTTSGTELIHT